jgi:hypothetical protein
MRFAPDVEYRLDRALLAAGRLDSGVFFAQTSHHLSDQSEPFDLTAAPSRRRRCFFCDVDESEEWNFVASLNRFVCKKCHDRIDETAPPKPKPKPKPKPEAEGDS